MSDYWFFKGIGFRRLSPGDGDPRWFPQTIATTVDVIAGDTAATPRRYVDIGAREHGPLSFVAGCDSQADAATLEGYLGQSGTLTNLHGRSAQALLTKADRLISDGGPFRQVAVEFIFLQ